MKILKLSTVSLAAIFAIGLITSSCNKVKEAIKVNIPLQQAEIDFVIPVTTAGTKNLADFNVHFNVDSAIKANASQFSASNIRSVKITSVKLTASNAAEDGDHFGKLSSATAKLSSNVNANLVTIAELATNPEAFAATLDIPVKDVELKDYFSGTDFSYVLSGTVRTATNQVLNCKATVKFDITVGL